MTSQVLETIEEIRWISEIVIFAMAWGSPIVPIGTVTGIMAWGEVFRGTTTREVFQRGWPWLLASIPVGYLLWLMTKDQPVPDYLFSD
jgi:hypothetical protein